MRSVLRMGSVREAAGPVTGASAAAPEGTVAVICLLGAFAVHNIEEIAHRSQDMESLPTWVREAGPWHDARSFSVATGLLTALVGVAAAAGLRSSGLPRAVLLGGPAAAVAGNAAGHVARALIQRRYAGGLATAPVMGMIAARVFSSSTRSWSVPVRRRIFLVGNGAALPASLGSLALGHRLTRSMGAGRCR